MQLRVPKDEMRKYFEVHNRYFKGRMQFRVQKGKMRKFCKVRSWVFVREFVQNWQSRTAVRYSCSANVKNCQSRLLNQSFCPVRYSGAKFWKFLQVWDYVKVFVQFGIPVLKSEIFYKSRATLKFLSSSVLPFCFVKKRQSPKSV